MAEGFAAAIDDLHRAVATMVTAPVLRADHDEMARLRSSIDVNDRAAALVSVAVDEARTAGRTWQEIGETFGISRQAAFQRFGKAIDPRTGAEMNAAPLAAASSLAADVVDALAAGRWSDVTAQFDATMRDALTSEALAAAWAQLAGLAGVYENRGDTDAIRAADLTVTSTALAFEAADFVARISFRDDRTIAGLYLLPEEKGPAS